MCLLSAHAIHYLRTPPCKTRKNHSNADRQGEWQHNPEEHIKNVRIAGGLIMAARAAGHWLVNELQRQGMSPGNIGYFSTVNGESIVAYEGPGVNPELDRMLGIIIENARRLNEALSWEFWNTAEDRTRIQSAIDGLELLPPR